MRTFSPAALKAARIEAGLSPEQLAIRIGRSVYSVHEYERGRVQPPVAMLAALSDALDCPVEELLAGERSVPLDEHIRRLVDGWPQVSSEQRDRLAVLLRGGAS